MSSLDHNAGTYQQFAQALDTQACFTALKTKSMLAYHYLADLARSPQVFQVLVVDQIQMVLPRSGHLQFVGDYHLVDQSYPQLRARLIRRLSDS